MNVRLASFTLGFYYRMPDVPENSIIMYKIELEPHRLTFRQPAGTSRGVYLHRDLWYLHLSHTDYPGQVGTGECAPLPQLSCDATPGLPDLLARLCEQINSTGQLPDLESLRPMPSVLFGLEIALRHLERGSWALWDTPFSRGEEGLQINGLIWMGNKSEMLRRIEEKLLSGFKCLKLKIGAINFSEELTLLRHIRCHFSAQELELRVDANGAFSASEAPERLEALAAYDLHSIEQPIAPRQWEALASLVANTPIPIALDEELIGWYTRADKEALLEAIQPQYIILKPSLHGSWLGCDEWIDLAEKKAIGWWATSALESNVGLNAIAQWCAHHRPSLPQGLGTGQLFETNTPLPLILEGERLWFRDKPMKNLTYAAQ